MNLSGFSVPFINGADFSGDHKPRTFSLIQQTVGLFQHIKPFFGGLQFFSQFHSPGRVGKIPRPHKADPLLPGPQIQMLQISIPAGGPAVTGMDMQIGNDHSLPSFGAYYSPFFTMAHYEYLNAMLI